ncbi:MAG TPA: metalloregulator ArsR/SmtB family transcription factor [Candidatus Aquilonibacter sp.]
MNAASVFAALGDETRLAIVSSLCKHGPRSIAELTHGTTVTRQAVTKHLVALADAGLVESERIGRESIWTLRPKKLAEVKRYLDQISLQWDAALARLEAYVTSIE